MQENKKISQEQLQKRVEELHRSTKTSFPVFAPIHEKLRTKVPVYGNWHKRKWASSIHTATATAFVVSFIISLVLQLGFPLTSTKPNSALAGSSSVTWTTQADFITGTTVGSSINTTAGGDVKLNGVGRDGTLTVSTNMSVYRNGSGTPTTTSNFNVNTDTAGGYGGSRRQPDGVVTTLNGAVSQGATSVVVTSATGFAVNDEILIARVQDTTAKWERRNITAINTNTLTVAAISATGGYASGTMVQRIPNYVTVTVNSGATITANSWGGSTGGVVALSASGSVTINSGGIVDANSLSGTLRNANNGSGGVSGNGASGGGGGGSAAYGVASSNTGATGGSGVAGAGGAAGAGIASIGSASDPMILGRSGGTGGSGGSGVCVGGTYSDGSCAGNYSPAGGSGGAGGTGGGLIFIDSSSITNNGTIRSNGGNGSNGSNGGSSVCCQVTNGGGGGGGGGRGSGGSVYLRGNTISNGSGSITATAGNDGSGGSGGTGYGGGATGGSGVSASSTAANSVGRIRFDYNSSAPTGTISPASGSSNSGFSFSNPGPMLLPTASDPTTALSGLTIDAGSEKAAKWSTVTWAANIPANSSIQVYTRGASTQGGLSGASWSSAYTTSGSSITTSASRWLEVKVVLGSADAIADPVLDSLTIAYETLEAPLLANTTIYKSDGTTQISTNGTEGTWTNETSVKIKNNNLTCTGCGTSTGKKIEVETKLTSAAFDGTTGLTQGDTNPEGTSTATISSLAVGSSYHFRLRTIDTQGRVSGWTNYGSGSDTPTAVADVSVDQTLPPAVTNTYGPTPTNQTVALTWTAVNDANSGTAYYRVYRSTTPGQLGSQINNNGETTTGTYNDTPPATQFYYYTVQAVDNAGNEQTLGNNQATIAYDIIPPDNFELNTPANNSWTNQTSPTLSWNASSDANGLAKYQLYVDGNLDTDNISNASTSTTPTTPLTEGTHTWHVKAVDNAGNVTQSTSTYTIGYDNTLPSAVAGLNASENDATKINLNWTAYSDSGAPVANYRLQRVLKSEYDSFSFTPTGDWSSAPSLAQITCGTGINFYENASGVTGNSCVIDSGAPISESTAYNYRIAVKDSVNASYGAWSVAVDLGMTLDSQPPTSSSDINVTACDGQVQNCFDVANKGFELKISWSPSVDAGVGLARYKIYRTTNVGSIDQNDYVLVGTAGALATSYWDNNANNDATDAIKTVATEHLVDYKNYYYRVTAEDAATPANESDFVPIVVDNYGSGKTVDATAPILPNLSLQATATSSSSIDLSWTQATDYSSDGQTLGSAQSNVGYTGWYKIYRSTDPNSGFVELTDFNNGCDTASSESQTACTNIGLAALTTYYYKIQAVDKASGTEDPSDAGNYTSAILPVPAVSVQTYTDAVPTAPINVSASATLSGEGAGTKTTVQFTGAASSKVGGTQGYQLAYYKVYRFTGTEQAGVGANTNIQLSDWISKNSATQVGGNISIISQSQALRSGDTYQYVDDNGYTVNDTGLANSSTYKYKVVAFDTTPTNNIPAGPFASPMSSTVTVTTPDKTASTDSANIEVDDTYGASSLPRLVVSWARAVEVVRDSTVTLAGSLTDNAGTISLSSGKGQYFVNGQYIKLDSEILKITNIAGDVLSVNRGANQTTASAHNSGSIISIVDFTKYRLYRDSGSGYSEITPGAFDELSDNYYIDTDIQASTLYKYKVTVVDDAGNFKGYKNNQPNQVINSGQNNESTGIESTTIDSANVDKTAPVITFNNAPISGNVGINTGVSSATIKWTTNETADTLVEYGETTNYTNKAGDISITNSNEALATTHTTTIKKLTPATTYNFRIKSKDANGNIATSANYSFVTQTFAIQDVAKQVTTSSATLTWKTPNVASSSVVKYKKAGSNSYDVGGNSGGVGAENTTQHSALVKNLQAGTYDYILESVDNDKNLAYTTGTFEIPSVDVGTLSKPDAGKIEEKDITATSVKITWTSTVNTSSWVDFGLNSGSYTSSEGSDALTTNHIVSLNNLIPDTTYYYVIRGVDSNGIEYISQEYSFVTVSKPSISNIKVKDVSHAGATVTWTTSSGTSGIVEFGKASTYGASNGTSDLAKDHEVKLENLEQNVTYHFRVVSTDNNGNKVASEDQTFVTELDKTPPVISGVKNEIIRTTDASGEEKVVAIISWSTDEEATSQVEYGVGLSGTYTSLTVADESLKKSHSIIISNLKPATSYHFRTISEDANKNQAKSDNNTMLTPAKQQSIFQKIIKALEESFAWVNNLRNFISDKLSGLF